MTEYSKMPALGSIPLTLSKIPLAADDAARLEEELAQIISQAHQAARSPSTRERYARVWVQFSQFCQITGRCPLPATADTILRFLAWYGTTRVTSTLRQARAAVRHHQVEAGFMDLTAQPDVTRFLSGHERMTGMPPVQKKALLIEDVRALCAMLEAEGGMAAIRDKAALLLGYAGALRASEAVSATRHHCQIEHRGLTMLIPRSKTDQQGRGQCVVAVRTVTPETCPVAAVEEWLALLKRNGVVDDGPLFPALRIRGERACNEYLVEDRQISTNAYRAMLKRRCADIGLDPATIGGHSLRSGHATQAAENGVDILEIAQQGRWRDLRKVQVYVRSGRRFSYNSSGKIGL